MIFSTRDIPNNRLPEVKELWEYAHHNKEVKENKQIKLEIEDFIEQSLIGYLKKIKHAKITAENELLSMFDDAFEVVE